jgi:hypothetical protein
MKASSLPNRHIHLWLFKLGYDVHVLLSSVMYILSGENVTAVYRTQSHDVGEIRTPHRLITGRVGQGPYTSDCSIFPPWSPPSTPNTQSPTHNNLTIPLYNPFKSPVEAMAGLEANVRTKNYLWTSSKA